MKLDQSNVRSVRPAALDTIMVSNSRTMRWSEHVAPTEEMRCTFKIMVGKPEWKKDYSEDLEVDGRIIQK
jgi:hypothetical protein